MTRGEEIENLMKQFQAAVDRGDVETAGDLGSDILARCIIPTRILLGTLAAMANFMPVALSYDPIACRIYFSTRVRGIKAEANAGSLSEPAEFVTAVLTSLKALAEELIEDARKRRAP